MPANLDCLVLGRQCDFDVLEFVPIESKPEVGHTPRMPAHLFDGLGCSEQVLKVGCGELSLRTSYDVSWTYHSFNRNGAEAALPCSHHVVDQIARCDTLIFGTIIAARNLSVQLFLIQLCIRYAVMNGHSENRKLVTSSFGHFSK